MQEVNINSKNFHILIKVGKKFSISSQLTIHVEEYRKKKSGSAGQSWHMGHQHGLPPYQAALQYRTLAIIAGARTP